MLDRSLLRRDPEAIRRSLRRRGQDASVVERLVELDRTAREAQTRSDALKAEKNTLSSSIAKAADKRAAAEELRPRLADIDGEIARIDGEGAAANAAIDEQLQQIPNILADIVPDGSDESGNVVVRAWGTPPTFDFEPKPHWELGERLGILDFERARKLAGSRFAVLVGDGARLSRAIVDFFLDRGHRAGYTEISPPIIVNRETMWSTGQLSKFSDDMFQLSDWDFFLIPTAEVPLTALHRDEILDGQSMPRRYAAYTPCFRKEAGAAGKDTRGLIRQHQFEKVELVWLTAPDASFEALERLTRDAENLLKELELPFRTVALCGGDTGFNAAATYDLEVWLPSQGVYREISSCSNCTDFQARRANIRFRRDAKSKLELVHTLNGSGLAVGRTLVAVIENGQQADGTIRVPEALVPYLGGQRVIGA
ncbi:MAG TPA: serine--tRNA ligase [Candidatus Dormibacteraeota bacterium]|nr:serine--tRNA ligase [Candidatus Dormibacteraeota bacterium]